MEFDQIITNISDFFQTHLLISIAALVVVIYFFYTTPKESFKFLMFVAILAIAGYFILQLGSSTDTGLKAKEELTRKTKKAIGE